MKNPDAALAAINAPLKTKVGRHDVRELTLGLASVLEQIKSPVMSGERPEALAAWAGTLYAFTRPAGQSRALLSAKGAGGYNTAALKWVDDDLPLAEGMRRIAAVEAAVRRLNSISAQDDGGDGGGNPSAAGPTAG